MGVAGRFPKWMPVETQQDEIEFVGVGEETVFGDEDSQW
jgi:hypothetical protein